MSNKKCTENIQDYSEYELFVKSLDNKKISVLGTEYTIKFNKELVNKDYDGMHHPYIRLIECVYEQTNNIEEDIIASKAILRHEIIHAFLFQSGLGNSLRSEKGWADNEEMVDWIALQYPKITKLFDEIGILY